MGKKMTASAPMFVEFRFSDDRAHALLPFDSVLASNRDLERLARKAARAYETAIASMRRQLDLIAKRRKGGASISARSIWKLGDTILRLVATLAGLGLEIDGLYAHLTRDLSVKRKWLEKVISFRRHIPDQERIPRTLSWGHCAKQVRVCAARLLAGLSVP